MSASVKKTAANRRNAALSTGPRTAAGKARAARNAQTYGILSKSLLIEGEDPAEYAALLESLIEDEQPETTLERLQCEQIAQAFWRMRRLAGAEAAAVSFARSTDDTRKMLNDTLGIPESAKFKDHHLEPLDELDMRHMASCSNILEELSVIQRYPEHEDELKRVAPVYADYLRQQAEKEKTLFYKYLMMRTGLAEDQFAESIKRCMAKDKPYFVQKILDYDQRLKLTPMRGHFQAMKVVPVESERFARYRTSIENSLEKAVRSLRQSQLMRLRVIPGEAQVIENDSPPSQ